MSDIVHYSSWSQQPDVWLACGQWTTPAYTQRDDLAVGVYEADGGDLYTFEPLGRVSCQGCLTSIDEGRTEPRYGSH